MKKVILVLTIGSLVLAGAAAADQIVKPHTFVNGAPALAEQVNTNFDTVYDQVNKLGVEINIDGVNHRVGIGTTLPPDAKLHVDGNLKVSNGNIELRTEGRDPYIELVSDDAGGSTVMRIKSLDGVGFAVTDNADVTRMAVMDTGNVGIGTTAPAEALEVIGAVKAKGLQVTSGAAAGLILTSDAIGQATWQTPPADGDGSAINEIQVLSLTGTDLTLSRDGGTVSIADNDNDPANEIQSLGLTGNTLAISGGNNVDLSGVGSDTLAALNCTEGQLAKFTVTSGWVCVDDQTASLQATINSQGAAITAQGAKIAALEALLAGTTRASDTITFSGVNVQIDNGTGTTSGTPNGLGNLIVGYNELRGVGDDRSGSHNLVAGANLNYSSFGGIVSGYQNSIGNMYASAVGGQGNTASGPYAVVSGGQNNVASGNAASVSGGYVNNAGGTASTVSGGQHNSAGGTGAAVSGGQYNIASGGSSAVSGGWENTANNLTSAVSGGQLNISDGVASAISGGNGNSATGISATVLGGQSNTAASNYQVVGHQIPVGSITSALIADGAIVNSDISAGGGIYSTKASTYRQTDIVLVPGGMCTQANARCNDANDLPIGGSCESPPASTNRIRSINIYGWDSSIQVAEYSCTFCNEGTDAEAETAVIYCVDVP